MIDNTGFLHTVFEGKPESDYILVWTMLGQHKQSKWFTDPVQAEAYALAQKDRDTWFGIGLSPSDYGSALRCKSDQVTGIGGLWADLDVLDPAHKAMNLCPNKAAAMELLHRLPLIPTVVVDSGHGLQPYWLFKEPWVFETAEDRRAARELEDGWLETIRTYAPDWALDGVADLARILRVPGSINHKGAPVMVNIIEHSGPRYDPSEIVEYLRIPEKRARVVRSDESPSGNILGGSYWLSRAIKRANAGNRHETGKWLAVQLRAAQLTLSDAQLIMDQYAAHCEELGSCDEPAHEHMAKLLDWAYEILNFEKKPVTPTREIPEEPEYLRSAPLEFIEAPPEEPDWLGEQPHTVDLLTQGTTNTGFTPPKGTKPIAQTSSWADIQESLASIVWEWPRWLARGIVHILVGQTGKGKSSVALAIASRYLTGNPWPDSTPFTSQIGKVLWLEGEAAQALNLQRVRLWSLTPAHIICPFPDPMQDVNLDNPQHQQAIAATAALHDVAIIIVDSLSGCMGSRRDENSTEMLNIVKWLAKLARDLQKPVILLHHLRKRGLLDTDDRIGLDRIRGSSAILQAARLVWALDSPTERDPEALRLSVIKSNLDRFPAPVGVRINEDGVVFSSDAPGKPDARTQLARSKEFLRMLLENGPITATRALHESEEAGFEKRWIEESKRKMGVKSFKIHNVWHWGWEWESEELPL
jgi:hypothetical protein